ncbi:polysaccharide lyase family 7 protein [Reinekea marinisedimentorum]|uniref:Poly(Beta-D-mannuronate) lyase n=1 Tax=Reinekea marinisedimentorum TaxID=230495 RepID=A0A4R3ICY8_9GAMM|nr:polysaccharide lyase family 7 protein [Reinekea marinisedimentorum]TCS43287.1 poly(beta-D-mannuronate) lyase [Reinekea marinisedimentorum]
MGRFPFSVVLFAVLSSCLATSADRVYEVTTYGCSFDKSSSNYCEPVALEVGNLDAGAAPGSNFELIDWYITLPVDEDGDGKVDTVKESELASGYEHSEYFYTGTDGGMVFVSPISSVTTSGSSYARSELREMLRRGNTSYSTKGVGKNNWVFGNSSSQASAGGVNGILRATLAVNHVTTTGESYQKGRVIIGQIHANDDEPVRLYYRKLPGNAKGSIYIAHEVLDGNDKWFELIGSRSDSASNPSDGIALDEVFSYEIMVNGDQLRVVIMRDGKEYVEQIVDMSNSGYDDPDQYMYFKAGVYNQNKSGDDTDYVQATFYALENSHIGYDD